jgi:hypothetical protein
MAFKFLHYIDVFAGIRSKNPPERCCAGALNDLRTPGCLPYLQNQRDFGQQNPAQEHGQTAPGDRWALRPRTQTELFAMHLLGPLE